MKNCQMKKSEGSIFIIFIISLEWTISQNSDNSLHISGSSSFTSYNNKRKQTPKRMFIP